MRIGFIFIWTCLLTSYCVNGICEEIQEKIVAFGKGKDLKELFQKYANKDGFITVKEMKTFLEDAGVSWGCRYPGKVIERLDQNNDKKLSYAEIMVKLRDEL